MKEQKNGKWLRSFSCFDELLAPFSSTPTHARSMFVNRRSLSGMKRQLSLDVNTVTQRKPINNKVRQNLISFNWNIAFSFVLDRSSDEFNLCIYQRWCQSSTAVQTRRCFPRICSIESETRSIEDNLRLFCLHWLEWSLCSEKYSSNYVFSCRKSKSSQKRRSLHSDQFILLASISTLLYVSKTNWSKSTMNTWKSFIVLLEFSLKKIKSFEISNQPWLINWNSIVYVHSNWILFPHPITVCIFILAKEIFIVNKMTRQIIGSLLEQLFDIRSWSPKKPVMNIYRMKLNEHW